MDQPSLFFQRVELLDHLPPPSFFQLEELLDQPSLFFQLQVLLDQPSLFFQLQVLLDHPSLFFQDANWNFDLETGLDPTGTGLGLENNSILIISI
ncbi:MAG: hypothetical protein EOM68_31525 [Spirochaetia bacterium]|nr:hypothetical protein [Spirochaetia bacterium]